MKLRYKTGRLCDTCGKEIIYGWVPPKKECPTCPECLKKRLNVFQVRQYKRMIDCPYCGKFEVAFDAEIQESPDHYSDDGEPHLFIVFCPKCGQGDARQSYDSIDT